MIDNDVVIDIYDGTSRILDISNDLEFAENVRFSTHIPGGDYGEASFFVERDVTDPILFSIGNRVTFTNGQTIVYEGFISGINRVIETDYQGIEFLCSGGTDWILMKYPLEKRWADNRIEEEVWQDILGLSTARDKFDYSRTQGIQFTPKGVLFANLNNIGLRYYMPVGETIKRVTFDYDLTVSAAAHNWTGVLYDPVGATAVWTVTRTTAGSSTGSVDVTLGCRCAPA